MSASAVTLLAAAIERTMVGLRAQIDELPDRTEEMRTALELLRCLRRLVVGRTADEIHRAFGAPGDFGYETPIGDALARVYGLYGSEGEGR